MECENEIYMLVFSANRIIRWYEIKCQNEESADGIVLDFDIIHPHTYTLEHKPTTAAHRPTRHCECEQQIPLLHFEFHKHGNYIIYWWLLQAKNLEEHSRHWGRTAMGGRGRMHGVVAVAVALMRWEISLGWTEVAKWKIKINEWDICAREAYRLAIFGVCECVTVAITQLDECKRFNGQQNPKLNTTLPLHYSTQMRVTWKLLPWILRLLNGTTSCRHFESPPLDWPFHDGLINNNSFTTVAVQRPTNHSTCSLQFQKKFFNF